MSAEKLAKRRRQLRSLVVMALADGSLGEREAHLVADRCAELGLDEYDMRKAVEYGLADDAAVSIPTDRGEQVALIEDLVRMMAADGRMDEGEKRLFALVAAKMSLPLDDVDRIIHRIVE